MQSQRATQKAEIRDQRNAATSDPHPSPPASPNRILQLQRTLGNQAVQRLLQSRALQAQLKINRPGDIYEQEADRVAEQVMRTAELVPRRSGASCGEGMFQCPQCEHEKEPLIHRKTTIVSESSDPSVPGKDDEGSKSETDAIQREEMPEEENGLQMKPRVQPQLGDGRIAAAADLEVSVQQARGGGISLADNIREPMEQAFGADFSGVKVHTDAQSDQLNRSMQARAFTTGQDVFFRQGEYNPGSRGGQELLAHELTHVVQQSGRTVRRSPKPQVTGRSSAVLPLQRTFGNQAAGMCDVDEPRTDVNSRPQKIAQRLQIKSTSGGAEVGAPIVQRAKLNIRKDKKTISGVSKFPRRPPSNLSKQRQHLTAYVTFEQAILSRVRDRTPTNAASELQNLVKEIGKLPYMASAGHVHASLNSIDKKLSEAAKLPDEKAAANIVGDQIDLVLDARNHIPGTAISVSGTTGHGEARTAGSLEMFETDLRQTGGQKFATDAKNAKQALLNMWELFDYNPPDPKDDPKLTEVQRRVLTHVMSMRTAFPLTFEWLTSLGEKYWLMPWLMQSLQSRGPALRLPLQRLSKESLKKVTDFVHTNL